MIKKDPSGGVIPNKYHNNPCRPNEIKLVNALELDLRYGNAYYTINFPSYILTISLVLNCDGKFGLPHYESNPAINISQIN